MRRGRLMIHGLLRRPTTVDDQRRAGDEGGFVGGKVEGGGGYLVGPPHAAHRLAGVKLVAHLVLGVLEMALQEALNEGCVHGAGADGVSADALADEVHGYRAGERDNRALAGAVR